MRAEKSRAVPGASNRRTVPSSGTMTFMIMRIVVVFPAPFGPSSP